MALAVSVMATATGTASANPRVKGEGEVRRAPNVADPSAFSILKWRKNVKNISECFNQCDIFVKSFVSDDIPYEETIQKL